MKIIQETCTHIGAKSFAKLLNKSMGIMCSYNQAQSRYNEFVDTLKWAWRNEYSGDTFKEWCDKSNRS